MWIKQRIQQKNGVKKQVGNTGEEDSEQETKRYRGCEGQRKKSDVMRAGFWEERWCEKGRWMAVVKHVSHVSGLVQRHR